MSAANMSVANVIRPAAARPGLFSRLAAPLNRWAEAQETRNQLNRLTDRELNDIGLCRGDIERVARGF